MTAQRVSTTHCKHCPGPLEFLFGNIATREIRHKYTENSVVPITERDDMLHKVNSSLFHPGLFF